MSRFLKTALAAALLAPLTAHAADATKFVAKSSHQVALIQQDIGCIRYSVEPQRYVDISNSSTQVYLTYHVIDECAQTYVAYGSGDVPASSLQGDARSSLSLKIDTATVPGLSQFGPAVVIDVKWVPIKGDFSSYDGSGVSQQGTTRYKYKYNEETQTARASGTIAGQSLATGTVLASYLYWYKNKNVTVTKNVAPALGAQVAPAPQ